MPEINPPPPAVRPPTPASAAPRTPRNVPIGKPSFDPTPSSPGQPGEGAAPTVSKALSPRPAPMEVESKPPSVRGSVGLMLTLQDPAAKSSGGPPASLQRAKERVNAELAAKFAAEQQAARGTADRSSRLSLEQFAARSRSRKAGESLAKVGGAAARSATRASSSGSPTPMSFAAVVAGAPYPSPAPPRPPSATQLRGPGASVPSRGQWRPNLPPAPVAKRPAPPWARQSAAPKPDGVPKSGGPGKAVAPPPPRGAGGAVARPKGP